LPSAVDSRGGFFDAVYLAESRREAVRGKAFFSWNRKEREKRRTGKKHIMGKRTGEEVGFILDRKSS